MAERMCKNCGVKISTDLANCPLCGKFVLAEKDKTGRWLGEQIGKSNCTISKYINQKVQPDLKTLNEIANVLCVDVKDLLVSNLEIQ